MVNRLRSMAVLATGLTGMTLGLSGCGGSFAVTTYHDEETTAYDVPAGLTAVNLLVDAADVEIVGTDTNKINVHQRLSWTKGRRPTPANRREGGTLVLGYRCPHDFTIGINTCSVDFRIQMPRALAAKIRTDSGDIRIRGTRGTVTAEADSGNIEATDLRGADVTARTDAGNIRVAGAGSVQAAADSGNIKLDDLSGDRMTAHVSSGNIVAAFVRAPRSVQASADSGNVTIRVPATEHYAIDARSDYDRPDITGLIVDSKSPYRITVKTDAGRIHLEPAQAG